MGGGVKIKAAGAGAGADRAAGGGGGGGGGHGGGITKYAQPFSGQSSCRQSLHLPVLLFMSHNVAEDLPLRCLRSQHLHLCLPLQQRCQSSNEKTAEVHVNSLVCRRSVHP